jgi:RNA polymerase sigma factor (sigma-70 family)
VTPTFFPNPLYAIWRFSIRRCSTLANSSNSRFVASIALQYGRGLRRFLTVHLRNADDVPDLAQEVYLRLLRVNHQEAIRNPEAYLFTVANHVLYQYSLRKTAKVEFVDITDAAAELLSPAAQEPPARAENSQRVERLQRILKRLPPRVGAALVMHRIGGYTVQEVANELGVARETAKKYLIRAAQHCRRTEPESGSAD